MSESDAHEAHPADETPLDTIWYEIVHWRYACKKLGEKPGPENSDKDLVLEAALVHYRNLIQFLSQSKPRNGLLAVLRPEEYAPDRSLTSYERARLDDIGRRGKTLYDAYWDDISDFLQHIKLKRSKQKIVWNLREMNNELEPLLIEFCRMFSNPKGSGQVITVLGNVVPSAVSSSAVSWPLRHEDQPHTAC